jgi:dihydrofolate reductase
MDMVVAVNKNGIIGRNNKLLWDIPEDMKHFRRLTNHSIIVMGRRTFDSLPFGPLKSRINIVITSTPNKYKDGYKNNDVIFCNLDESKEILKKLQTNTNKGIFIIGGAEIYKYFFSKCKNIYVTHVDTDEREGVSIKSILIELSLDYKVIEKIGSYEEKKTGNPIKYEIVKYVKNE